MIRTQNLTDSTKGALRRVFHNPLFNVTVNQWDDVLLETSKDPDFFWKKLYVPSPSADALLQNISRDMPRSSSGLLYLLLGRKGQGKTVALLDLYARLSQRPDAPGRLALYFDLKNKKSDDGFHKNLHDDLIEMIFEKVKTDPKVPREIAAHITDPPAIRELDANYRGLTDPMLHQRVLDHKVEAARYLLGWLSRNGQEIFLIFDNVDDFPKTVICRLIDACAQLRDSFNAKCLIALRDYWSQAGLGIEDQQTTSLHLSDPDIYAIVRRRLDAMDLTGITQDLIFDYGDRRVILRPADLINIFEEICNQILQDKTVGGQLLRLVNYNVRDLLHNIYYFFHSPYLFARPIFIKALVRLIQQEDPNFYPGPIRRLHFYDFIECFMGIHYLCFDKESRLFNMFHHEFPYAGGPNFRNTLIFWRVLQIANHYNMPFPVEMVFGQLEAIGYEHDAIYHAVEKLLNDSMIESTEGVSLKHVTLIRLSVKGSMYLDEILPEYTYCMFIADAVPMPDEYKVDVREKFGDEAIPIQRGALHVKHASVQKFLTFLQAEEKEEEQACPPDKVAVLHRIRNEKLQEMAGKVLRAMARMTASADSPRTRKITHVGITEARTNEKGDTRNV